MNAPTPTGAKPDIPTRADIAGKIAYDLIQESFGTGSLAELRRLYPNGPLDEPALHRLLARRVPESWTHGEGLRHWALIIHCLALAAPDHLGGGEGLGKTLYAAGFSEKRFVNLLNATPDELRDRLPRATRFLVHRGGKLHGPQLADLVLNAPDTPHYDGLRQKLASDYYRAEYEASKQDAAAH